MAIGLVDAIADDPINAAKLIDQKILSEVGSIKPDEGRSRRDSKL